MIGCGGVTITVTKGFVYQAESRRRGLRDGQPARFVGAEHRRRGPWRVLNPRLHRRTSGTHVHRYSLVIGNLLDYNKKGVRIHNISGEGPEVVTKRRADIALFLPGIVASAT